MRNDVAGTGRIDLYWMPLGAGGSGFVVILGAVGAPLLSRWRTFRYEVRTWRNGVLPDADAAVGGPRRISDGLGRARRVRDLTGSVPALVWGRDQLGTGDMWNSNSVISWLLTRAGVPMAAIDPPDGGRAPGWKAGICVASNRPTFAFDAQQTDVGRAGSTVPDRLTWRS